MVIRLLSAFLLGFFILGCNAKNSVMPKTAFARVYLDSLRIKYPNVKFGLNNELVITSKYGDLDYKHHIDDDYLAYRDAPDSIGEIIGRYVASTKDLYADLRTIFVKRIIPVIIPVEYLAEADSLNKDGKPAPIITDKYNSQLVIAYAEVYKNSITYLTEDDVKRLSISGDSLKSIATRNIDRITVRRNDNNGLYILVADGKKTSALILSAGIWTKSIMPVDGEFIIAIPNADSLLVTGSNNRTGILKLKEMAADLYKSGQRKISNHLFKWTGNKFEIYD